MTSLGRSVAWISPLAHQTKDTIMKRQAEAPPPEIIDLGAVTIQTHGPYFLYPEIGVGGVEPTLRE